MTAERPQKTRDYTNHHAIDGDRWRVYEPRGDDIIITTSIKAGTTWMQTIIANLIFQDGKYPDAVSILSPWLDMAMPPLEMVAAGLSAQTTRRFIKTHLPLDGIRLYDQVKYVFVGRDGRDVFMSLWNHHMKYTDLVQEGMSAVAESQGRAIRFDYANKREFWQDWISKGSFDWEQDGFPYWSHFHHAQTWWNFRHLPNILSVHFADLLRDPEAEIRRIAAFLDIEIQEDHFPSVLERVTFGEMKKDFERIFAGSGDIWQGGEKTFMNKGTNGRWRDVLTQEDLAQYDEAVAKVLTPDCAKWLENGGHPA